MKDKIMGKLQVFSKAIIVPVLFLPIVGLVLALGTIIGNPKIVGEASVLIPIGKYISQSLWPIMTNLNLIFAIGVAMGIAKEKKQEAALIAVIAFFVFLGANQQWLTMTDQLIQVDPGASLTGTGQAKVLGFQVIDMGVFLGIILGTVVGVVHNKFCNVEFKGFFNAYGNTKFVLIVLIPIILVFSVVASYLWPFVSNGITALTNVMKDASHMGVGLYGFVHKLLIPTGLHHLVWSPFSLTSIGGTMEIGGQMYEGYRNIFLAELSDPSITYFHESARFAAYGMSKIFGLTGVALAFYFTAFKDNKSKVKAILIPVVLTSVLVGITEPLEFTFLFVSPILWVVHAVLDGLFQAITSLAGVRCYATGGLIDFIVYNIPAGIQQTRWPVYILIGLVQLVVYFVVFRTLILKFKMATPGREKEVKLYSKEDYKDKVKNQKDDLGATIIVGLGGKENIVSVDNCFTRLRVVVKDSSLLDQDLLKETGASGVIIKENSIQVIYGPIVDSIKTKVSKAMED